MIDSPLLARLDIDEAVVFGVDMRHRFRGVTRREGMLLRRGDRWAEFSPFLDYPPAEAAEWLAAALSELHELPPVPVRNVVAVNCTIPATDPATAFALAAASGCTTAKVKVGEAGQSLSDDIERVAAVRDALGADAAIRVDANGAWGVADAIDAITALNRYRLEYVEQPCAEVAELAKVRAAVSVPIAADESIRRAADPLAVARAGAADVVVIKLQPLGGVARALSIVGDVGLPAVVSSALETSVGLAAGVRLAAALPDLPYACGLNTALLLTGDVTSSPVAARGGVVPADPVVSVDRARLAEVVAPAHRQRYWWQRLDAAARMRELT